MTGLWFSPSTPDSSTNKTDRHNITEILLKVVLNTITPLFCRERTSLWIILLKFQDLSIRT